MFKLFRKEWKANVLCDISLILGYLRKIPCVVQAMEETVVNIDFFIVQNKIK